MIEAEDLELKELKLYLVDLICPYVVSAKEYISCLSSYERELRSLVGLPKDKQRKELENIADNVIAFSQKGC